MSVYRTIGHLLSKFGGIIKKSDLVYFIAEGFSNKCISIVIL